MIAGLHDPAEALPSAGSATSAGRGPLPGRIGLWCNRLGSFGNPQTPRDSRRLLDGAYDLGVRVFATANVYGQGDSERALGAAFSGARRDEVFFIVQAGRTVSAKAQALCWAKPLIRRALAMRGKPAAGTGQPSATPREDWRPEALTASLDGSLRRLRTDHVDAFVLYSPPPAVAADPAVGAALAAMRRAGHARHIGVLCDDAATLRAALTIPDLSILQMPLWLLVEARRYLAEVACRDIRIVVL